MVFVRRLLLAVVPAGLAAAALANPPEKPPLPDPFDAALPNDALRTPDAQTAPLRFVTRNSDAAGWAKLPAFWNEATEAFTDPATGKAVERRVVHLKVPLGLNAAPPSPAENPVTVAKWELGKRLYYDPILSSNAAISCATCHDPAKGFGDQRKTSQGINSKLGGVNAPTVINSGYHTFQFWDGRAASLEEQAQGPVSNNAEMFGGDGDAWESAVARLLRSPDYVKAFEGVFGHLPTKDAAAKAIAAYERTVLSGNSLYDRAQVAMRKRAAEDDEKPEIKPVDYEAVLTAAFGAKDANALAALGLDPAADAGKTAEVGRRLANGQVVYFGKARCSNCHVGDNLTDNQFHNLGVGAVNGKLAQPEWGRWTRLPTGHKDSSQVGAFKTPGLRALLNTQPYMHDGGEQTLEAVVEFYDRGGNANEFLDPKMRDQAAEEAYLKATAAGQTPPKPPAFTRGGKPVVPFKLNLSAQEKADLVLFLKALQGDPVDPMVADPTRYPAAAVKVTSR